MFPRYPIRETASRTGTTDDVNLKQRTGRCRRYHTTGAARMDCARTHPPTTDEPPTDNNLLELNLGAGGLELLLHLLGVSLGHAFLHGLRCTFDQVLGFLQAQ